MNLDLPDTLSGGGLVLPYGDSVPTIGKNVFIAPHAAVIGQVTLGDRVSVWFGTVLRGDIAAITIGEGSNIQDNSILHVGSHDPCVVGKNVTVGHGVILHGCTVEDDCVIGMGAIVLNRAIVGRGSVVGAGALVTQDTVIPPHFLALGSPAKVTRELTNEECEQHKSFVPKYVGVTEQYQVIFSQAKENN